MFHYSETVTNLSGDALIGYFGRVIDKTTGGVVTIASDGSGTPIATVSGQTNMAATDSGGELSFYVEPGDYHLDIYGPDAVTFIKRYTDQPMGNASAAAAAVSTAADRVQTGLDRVATAADRVQTGLDRTSTSADAAIATAARDAASISGKLFADTTTGLANTSSSGSTNRYFGVPSTDTTYVTEYRNDAGVATLINTYPSLSGLAALTNIPNGTMQRALTLVTAAGTTYSATVQTALRNFEYQLRQMQLNSYFIRLNPFFGTAVAGARIPFIQRAGVGYSSDTGTIGSWTESAGLVNANLDTGVTLAAAGLDVYNMLFGCYNLVDPNGAGSDYVVGNSAGSWGLYPDIGGGPTGSKAGLFAWDFAGRIFARTNRATTGAADSGAITKGPMSGYRRPDGTSGIMLCGYPLADATSALPFPQYANPLLTIAEPTANIFAKSLSNWPLGGYWIADAMPEDALAAFHRIYHDLQVCAGRGVDTEGY